MRWWFVEHHGTPHRTAPLKRGVNTHTNNSFQLHSALYVVGTIFHNVLHDLKQKNQLSKPNPRMIWLDLQESAYRISHWLSFPSPHKLRFLVFSEVSWTLCYIKIKRGTFLATPILPPQKTQPTPLQEGGVYCRLFSDSTIPASKYFIITPDDNWKWCNPRKEQWKKPFNMAMTVTRVWQCTFPISTTPPPPPPSPLSKLGSGMHTLSMQ